MRALRYWPQCARALSVKETIGMKKPMEVKRARAS